MKSILNTPFTTPFNTAPFSKINTADFLPAIQKEIEKAKKEIDQITALKEPPTFENTIEALEYCGAQLDRVTSIFFNLNSAETNSEIQKAAQEISPMLSEFQNDIILNTDLFQKIKIVYSKRHSLNLNREQHTLLDKKYKGFTRNGANLNQSDKQILRDIDKKLSQLTLKFGENVLAETNDYQLHIEDPLHLKGLPESVIETAADKAGSLNKKGWVFTLDYPSYIPFMKYCKNRALRKKMALAFGSKGFHNDQYDNQKNILDIVRLRHQRAQLLGFASHAHFVLEERMAKTPEKVISFLTDILEKAKPAAEKEYTELEKFAKESDSIEKLQFWDGAFYTDKLRMELFDLDDEQLKPYFQLDNVVKGAFLIAQKLFGLSFREVHDIDVYHNEVKTYEVYDENQHFKAILYTDFHPRPGKRNGAWMTSYKPQYKQHGNAERPHISIVCNFTRPTKNKPSLLSFNEVTTLFHEFGHALHGILANTIYPSLSGTNVYWDFVELPSQVMENWCYEQEALALFAFHYETGDRIPMELIEKIKKSATFMEGMQTLRQVSFGLLDMSWHESDPFNINDVKLHEERAFESTRLYPNNKETCMSTSFSHIFHGGYSTGYYSYKWAEVLDADAFEYFSENGIFNKEIAYKFKEYILSRGGTENPMALYKKFRGKEPQPEALLRRAGLIDKAS